MRTAVVTGAAGFLGGAIASALRSAGWEVRGLDLKGDPSRAIVAGDISRPGAWSEVLTGADLVVHTAAIVAEAGDRRAFVRVNVEGTRHVLEAAEVAGVARAVHLSSIVVYGSDFPDGVTEDAPVQPSGNPYTDTKIGAEHAALQVSARGRLPVTIVRPGDIYGPGSQPWTVRPVRLLRQRLFALVDGGRGILSPTYVNDLVAGVLAAATTDAAAGRTYNLTGGVGVPAKEFFAHYADALGVRLTTLPRPLAVGAATAISRGARVLGRTPPLSPEAFEYVTHPGTYSIDRATSELDWRPEVDLAEGMGRTLAWLTDQGML